MTRNSGRNLPKNLLILDNQTKNNDTNLDAAAEAMINMTTKQQQQQQENPNKPDSETLERGRRKKFRYFVASLGLTVAAANCYAQATFCIAIVEMVLPADYVFKGDSGSLSAIKVVTSQSKNATHRLGHSIQPIEELESLSCPVEYKYRDYYDEWRFPNASSSPLASLLSKATPVGVATVSSSSHVIDISNRFDWDASRQGLLLGAFAMGMAPLQVLGGRLAEIYGAKWVLLAGCVGTALTNLTIPVLAHFSYTLLVVNRLLMGVAQAGMEPGLMCLMAQWLAPAETGFFISMLLFALCIGYFLGSLLSSLLLAIGLGWALTYYVTGGLNLIMGFVWLVYASKGPEESGLISEEELAYIKHEQQQERAKAMYLNCRQDISSARNNDLGQESIICAPKDISPDGNAPWLNILSTPSVWAFIICKISVRWCADVLTIELPTYLANVLHLSIKLNGILNSLSSAFFAIFSFITGYFVNELLKQTHEGAANEQERRNNNSGGASTERRASFMSKTTLRKLFQSVASFGSAIAIFLMTHYDCNIQLSMSMMFILSACLMMGTGGELQIPYDMTSRYPGTLHGMACTLSVSGWLAPPLIGLILGDQPSSRHRWSIVWYLTASINFVGGLVFVLFADASPRNFDRRASSKKGPTKSLHQQRMNNNNNNNINSVGADNNGAKRQQQQRHKVDDAGPTCAGDVRASITVVNLGPAQTTAAECSLLGSSSPSALPLIGVAPAPLSGSSSFDGGGLLKIRQVEGSLLAVGSQLDSMLAGQLTDMMFPYQQQQQQQPPRPARTKIGLSNGSGLFAWLTAGAARRRQQRKRQQQNGHLLSQERDKHFSSLQAKALVSDNGNMITTRKSKTITRL